MLRQHCLVNERLTLSLWLTQHMGFAAFDADQVIFRQGDTGEHFYIILSGAIVVSVNDAGDSGEQVRLILLQLYLFCKQATCCCICVFSASTREFSVCDPQSKVPDH